MDAVVIGTIISLVCTLLIIGYLAYRFFVIIGRGGDDS